MISVMLCDDHELYLEGTKMILEQAKFNVCAVASNGKQLLELLSQTSCDVLLLDVHLPDYKAEDLVEIIRERHPGQKIIYLTMMRGSRNIHRLKAYQIQGYLLKDAAVKEVIFAIESVYNGGQYFSSEDASNAKTDLKLQPINIGDNNMQDLLTRREIEILRLICQEHSNAAIAQQLYLSTGTVDTHRKNIIQKLGVKNTVGLVRYAIKNQLLDE